jgi:hypothetical protein
LTPRRRQDSTIEAIAATLGPACSLPMCSQFLRPRAKGRIAPSHQLCRLEIYAAWLPKSALFPQELEILMIAEAA